MSSRRVLGRLPFPGSCPITDRIRERRGARGLTPLDEALLHVPPIANGWNELLGAVRTQGKLPADVRELMILRVAAHNHAAFEWIHHENVGRDAGLTTAQLTVIRNVSNSAPQTSSPDPLTPLQAAALAFADASTKGIKVPDVIFNALSDELKYLMDGKDDRSVQDLTVEAAAVVGTYNMVSRFLVSLDVAGMSDDPVPWPVDFKKAIITYFKHTIPIPNTTLNLHAITQTTTPTAPWLVFSNSLLTNTSLWSIVTPKFTSVGYNLLLFDQRGHGLSSVPDPPRCTMAELADDIAVLLDHFGVDKAHAIIGASQGGAAALQFAIRYPGRITRVVACDTQAKSPEANIKAWDDRIDLAKQQGMRALATATVDRWFSANSTYHSSRSQANFVLDMIASTPLLGFEAGARALQGYDLIADGLLRSKVKTLLVAGREDGMLPKSLELLRKDWSKENADVKFAEVERAGHLPMVDEAETWLEAVVKFLE